MTFSEVSTLTKESSKTQLNNAAFEHALELFKDAASRVPAYKDFIKKEGINSELISTEEDFRKLPIIDKANYFTQYSLEDLSWDGKLDKTRFVSTSSGSTGE